MRSILPSYVVKLNLPEEKHQGDMQVSMFGLVSGSPAKSESISFPEVFDTPPLVAEASFSDPNVPLPSIFRLSVVGAPFARHLTCGSSGGGGIHGIRCPCIPVSLAR